MSDYELIRRDNEYHKEIRRRKMTDAAKMGLLVTQNIQQFQTNQILAQVHNEACRTNQFLGHMANTLEQIAHMQATHFEQVQRERSLKELIFQFGKFLDESEAYGDQVAAAFGMKRLFEVLDRSESGFSTADLSDLGDKNRLDVLITRARSLLTGLPHHQYEELEQFERLLGVYHERKATGFNAEMAFPEKLHITLPEEFRKPPKRLSEAPECQALVDAKKLGEEAASIAGCGGCLVFIGGSALVAYIPTFMLGEDLLIPIVLGLILALAGVSTLLYCLFGIGERQAILNQAQLEQKHAEQQLRREQVLEQKRWDARKRDTEAKIVQENQQIDSDNAEIDEKRRQATRLFQATMSEMRALINGFLDQHPPIQKFVARV